LPQLFARILLRRKLVFILVTQSPKIDTLAHLIVNQIVLQNHDLFDITAVSNYSLGTEMMLKPDFLGILREKRKLLGWMTILAVVAGVVAFSEASHRSMAVFAQSTSSDEGECEAAELDEQSESGETIDCDDQAKKKPVETNQPRGSFK
jgi:hypothetical protein